MEEKNLWGDIKKGASEGFGALKVELTKVAREIEKQGKVIKKKMDMSSTLRLVNQGFTRLGARIYELTEEGKNQDILKDELVSSIIAQIDTHKKEVRKIEKEIEDIKSPSDKDRKKEPAKKPTPKSKDPKTD